MLDAIERNSGKPIDVQVREDTVLAALLHDVGHGPFSHTLEEILGHDQFDHEAMTVRFLTEPDSEITTLLERSSPGRSQRLAEYIDKDRRTEHHWWHAVVSSQLDADRLDYIQRDARMAGIDNHRPDIERLISHISCYQDGLVVDHRAFDVIESMLLALDHLYGAVYFHRTVRAATVTVQAVLSRVKARVAKELPEGDPLRALLEQRKEIALDDYVRVTDASFWYHLDRWRQSEDEELSFYVKRLGRRKLPKHLELPENELKKARQLENKALELAGAKFPGFNLDSLVTLDTPSRVNYKRYAVDGDFPIFTWERDATKPRRIEDIEEVRSIVPKVARKFYRSRLFVPPEIFNDLRAFAAKERLL